MADAALIGPSARRKTASLDWARLVGPAAGLVMFACVLLLTLGDDLPRPQVLEGQDKFEHVIAFMALGLAFGWNASLRAILAYALVLMSAAFAIEKLQDLMTTTREGGLVDALAGCLGAGAGLSVAFAASYVARLGARRSARA